MFWFPEAGSGRVERRAGERLGAASEEAEGHGVVIIGRAKIEAERTDAGAE